MRIGIIGYSGQDFDKDFAERMIVRLFDVIAGGQNDVVVVSGYTDCGVPSLAYAEAEKRGWRTAGYANQFLVDNYPLRQVDEPHVIGKNLGDESTEFLASLDVLVQIGGGNQSKCEAAKWQETGKPFYKAELAAIPQAS